MGETALRIIGIGLALILVGAGLARRRLPPGKLARLALLWIGIIAVLWAVVTLLRPTFI